MAWTREEAKNVDVTVENGHVVLRIDPASRFGPSSTGKTIIVAKGVVEVPGYPGLTVSITAYTKAK